MIHLCALVLAICQITLSIGPPCSGLESAKKRTYGFRPSQLTKEERARKSAEMDEFWKFAKQLGPTGVNCLSDMLKEEKDDTYFLFDGAALLYSLDKSEAPTAVVRDAALRSSLTEVEPSGYIRLVLDLSHHGTDVGPLAVKYLTYPKVDTYLPQHAMKLDRLEGGVMLFGSMPAAQIDQYLSPLLASDKPEVRNTAAMLLAFNMTEESFKALKSPGLMQSLTVNTRREMADFTHYAPPKPLPPPIWSGEEVLKFLRRIPHTQEEFKALEPEYIKYRAAQESKHGDVTKKRDGKELAEQIRRDIEESEPFFGISGAKRFEESAIQTLTEEDLNELREDRRKSVTGASDEALYEYFAYTRIILGVINRLNLYNEWRAP